jgi:hypothetical protein
MGSSDGAAGEGALSAGDVPVAGYDEHPQAAPARTKTTRNLHAAIARRHRFNAHYVHDRASVLRRFGARPLKRR